MNSRDRGAWQDIGENPDSGQSRNSECNELAGDTGTPIPAVNPVIFFATGDGSRDANLHQRQLSLEELAEILSRHRVGEKDGPYFIAAQFRVPYRKAENVLVWSAAVLDLDYTANATEEMIRERLAGHAYSAYTTHTPGRWRVVLPYSRPVPPTRHQQLCRQLNTLFPGADDCNAKSLQFFYLPSHAEGDTPSAFNTFDEGELLDPDEDCAQEAAAPGFNVHQMLSHPRDLVPHPSRRLGRCADWLEAMLSGEDLHGNALSVVGSLVSQRVPKDVILSVFGSMRPALAEAREPGRVADFYGRELERLVDDIIAKEAANSAAAAFGVAPGGGLLKPRKFDNNTLVSPLPARDWLYGDMLLRGAFTILTGKGGVAKSVSALAVAISIAVGFDFLGLSRRELSPRRVYVLNMEDDYEEMLRRLRGLVFHYELSETQLALLEKNLAFESGYGRPLRLVAERPKEGVVENEGLIAELVDLSRGFDAVIMDPLVGFHSVNENSNDGMESVARVFRRLAGEAQVAVLVVHHSHKGAAADDPDNAARGASAVVNAARGVMAMTKMTTAEAKKFGVDESERTRFVRVDNGKSNYALPLSRAQWLRLESVPIEAVHADTGEEVGEIVGVPVSVRMLEAELVDKTDLQSLVSEILLNEMPSPFIASASSQHLPVLAQLLGCGKTDKNIRRHLNCLFPLVDQGPAQVACGGRVYYCWRNENPNEHRRMEYHIEEKNPCNTGCGE